MIQKLRQLLSANQIDNSRVYVMIFVVGAIGAEKRHRTYICNENSTQNGHVGKRTGIDLFVILGS